MDATDTTDTNGSIITKKHPKNGKYCKSFVQNSRLETGSLNVNSNEPPMRIVLSYAYKTIEMSDYMINSFRNGANGAFISCLLSVDETVCVWYMN